MKKATQQRFEELRLKTKGTSHSLFLMQDGNWRFRFTNMFTPPVFTGTLEGVVSQACDWIEANTVETPQSRMLRTTGPNYLGPKNKGK